MDEAQAARLNCIMVARCLLKTGRVLSASPQVAWGTPPLNCVIFSQFRLFEAEPCFFPTILLAMSGGGFAVNRFSLVCFVSQIRPPRLQ